MLMNGKSEGMIIMQHTTVLWNESTCGFRVTKKAWRSKKKVVQWWLHGASSRRDSPSVLCCTDWLLFCQQSFLQVVFAELFPASQEKSKSDRVRLCRHFSCFFSRRLKPSLMTHACIFCLTNWRIKPLYCSQSDSCKLHPPLKRKLRAINQLHPVFIFFPSLVERVGFTQTKCSPADSFNWQAGLKLVIILINNSSHYFNSIN